MKKNIINKPTILMIFGTRPEAIKMAPVYHELRKLNHVNTKICVTGQHRELLEQALNVFDIKPDINLNLMKENQDLLNCTIDILKSIGEILEKIKPNLVLVHGDTTTSMAASLASYYKKIPVGHIEAGLSTFRKYSPYPEEINRRISAYIADIHFAPTQRAKDNLISFGIKKDQIEITGNTVIDALFHILDDIKRNKPVFNEFSNIDFNKKILLVTAHRRENFGDRLKNICIALKEIALMHRNNVEIIYPVHPNPNVRGIVNPLLSDISNIKIIEPLSYKPFIYLMSKSYLILTDSGGIQEEAPSLGKPVLVLRDTSERPEAIDIGTAKLVDTNKRKIVNETHKLLTDTDYYNSFINKKNPYGDGKASLKIAKFIDSFLDSNEISENINKISYISNIG